ncbi:MazG nucleotide pyrophosphohydrolase domain protein [Phycisphaerae bacterium RAS1]|nr:MazG nucleotide pyrophosphohydrolase domain protein [Phycisphaerae bacterium RAS1]
MPTPPAAAGDAHTSVQQLRDALARFVAERKWEPFHDAKNLSMSIAIEAAELMEHFQWVRSEDLPRVLADDKLRGEINDELADILCYSLSLANTLGIDVSRAVLGKIEKNARKYPAEKFQGRYEKPR